MTAFEEAKALFFEGMAAVGRSEFAAAERSFRRSLDLVPDRVSVLINLAGVLFFQNRMDDAAAVAMRATALDPQNADAWLIVGRARRHQNRPDDALAALDRVVTIRPDDADAWAARGAVLAQVFRFADAAAAYDRALALTPEQDGLAFALGERLHARLRVGDWHGLAEERQKIRDGIAARRLVCQPGFLLSVLDDPGLQLACARLVVESGGRSVIPEWHDDRYHHARIRLAYLSPDFRDHALSYLTVGLFEHHDRQRFEVTGISVGIDDATPFRRRVAAAFDTFIDARGWSDADLAAWIRKAEVDILVDLAGQTDGGRPGLLAARAAPVQVTYLGFPGTSGIPAVDYIIADDFVVPPGSDAGYSEKVVRLPGCFQANDDRRRRPSVPPARSLLGLPDGAFVFCGFNNTYKLNPETFDAWMRLLNAVPDAILWLVADQPGVPATLRHEAEKRGVAAGRLVFANRVPYADHLARLTAADLFLDTLPFNAGTTASDVLWAGLPLVTCAGQAFAARMAGSLLRAVGLPDLVTNSLRDYEALALRLATSPDDLSGVRSRLAQNRSTAPLFDTARFCRNLEAAYVRMWERAEVGLPPEAFTLPRA